MVGRSDGLRRAMAAVRLGMMYRTASGASLGRGQDQWDGKTERGGQQADRLHRMLQVS